MAAAVDRGPEAIQRTMQELRWESMPDRVRFANPIERRWFSNRQEGWREYVVLETLDGFEKKEWVEPRAEHHIVPCRPVFKMMPLGSCDPDLTVPVIEKRMLFERTTDKNIDGMTIFRELPT